MKVLVVLAFVALFYTVEGKQLEKGSNRKLGGVVDGLVNITINAILKELDDIFDINEFSIPIKSRYIGGKVSVNHVEIYGVKQMIASAIKIKAQPNLKADLTFSMPNFTIAVYNYSIDLRIMHLIPYRMKGNVSLTFNNLRFLVIAGVKKLTVDDFKFCMNMGDSKFHITGLFSDSISKYLSDTFTRAIAPFVNEYASRITELVSPIVLNLLNQNKHFVETVLLNYEEIEKSKMQYEV